jgi:2-methylcitrate dehydratase PrpD
MNKISVRQNDEFTEQFRPPGMEIIGSPRMRVTIRTKSGDEFVREVTYHKGHSLNPMTVADIDAKLDAACRGVVDDDHKQRIRSAWWSFDDAETMSGPMDTLARFPGAGQGG